MKGTGAFMQHSLTELRIRQFWTQKDRSVSFAFYFRYFLTMVFCVPFWFGLLLHLVVVSRDHLEVNLSVDISVLTSVLGLSFMSLSIVWRHRELLHLFNALIAPTEFGKLDKLDKTVRKLNLYSMSYASYCCTGTLIYVLIKYQQMPECLQYNEEKGLQEICGVMTQMWTPFDINFNQIPHRHLLMFYQTVCTYIIICGGAAISFTTFEAATILVLKMEHLGNLLRRVFDDPSDAARWNNLHVCIKYHRHIISLQASFNKQYKYPNGSYVLMVGIVIAGLANQYMKENNLGALIHLGGWVFSFYICSHAGQILRTESLEIPLAAYSSKWYQVPVDLQKIILMIVTRSQKPLELRAAPIGVMSHELFIALVKTSTSYFALLNQST